MACQADAGEKEEYQDCDVVLSEAYLSQAHQGASDAPQATLSQSLLKHGQAVLSKVLYR